MLPFMQRTIKVTSPFGERIHPITKEPQKHNGVDLAANNEPLYCPEAGTVEKTYDDKLNGIAVRIDHGTYKTAYVHLSSLYVQPGDSLSEGQNFGVTGSTGRSTGPHLHFGYIDKQVGAYVDPMPYVNKLWSLGQYAENISKGNFTIPPISYSMIAVGGLAIVGLIAAIVYTKKG